MACLCLRALCLSKGRVRVSIHCRYSATSLRGGHGVLLLLLLLLSNLMSASGTEINPALLAKVPAYGRVVRGTSPCASSVVANPPIRVSRCVAEFGSKRRDRHWMSRCTFWHIWHSTPQPATSLVVLLRRRCLKKVVWWGRIRWKYSRVLNNSRRVCVRLQRHLLGHLV